jgi:hypothetical protein
MVSSSFYNARKVATIATTARTLGEARWLAPLEGLAEGVAEVEDDPPVAVAAGEELGGVALPLELGLAAALFKAAVIS